MKVVASMATMPGRAEARRLAVESLLPQVDLVHIHFNGFAWEDACREVRRFELKSGKLGLVSYSGGPDNRGDQMKFLALPARDKTCRLVCDDDLIYPPDYAQKMCAFVKRFGVVSAHGAKLTKPFESYYRSRKSFHCTANIGRVHFVDVLGTGTMAYKDIDLRWSPKDFLLPNMADIWVAIALKKRQLAARVVPHARNWIQLATPEDERTIWHASWRGDGSFLDTSHEQTQMLKEHASLFGI